MKKFITLAFLVFVVGCRGVEPESSDNNKDGNNDFGKPINGQIKLKDEILKIGVSSTAENSFDVDLTEDTKVLTKDYFFSTDASKSNFLIQVRKYDTTSCKTISKDPRFFVIADSVFTEIKSNVPFQLDTFVNYRLQIYTDQMECTRLKVSFSVKSH